MNPLIETIKSQNVPVGSVCTAAQHLGLSGIGLLNDSDYIDRIEAISGSKVAFDDSNMYRITYSYLVTEIIKLSDNSDVLDVKNILLMAKAKALTLITDNPWMFAVVEGEQKLDSAGNIKPKKGAKKDMAKKVYNDLIKDKVTARKDAIAILVKEVGLTPAGASTYYANLKKGVL